MAATLARLGVAIGVGGQLHRFSTGHEHDADGGGPFAALATKRGSGMFQDEACAAFEAIAAGHRELLEKYDPDEAIRMIILDFRKLGISIG